MPPGAILYLGETRSPLRRSTYPSRCPQRHRAHDRMGPSSGPAPKVKLLPSNNERQRFLAPIELESCSMSSKYSPAAYTALHSFSCTRECGWAKCSVMCGQDADFENRLIHVDGKWESAPRSWTIRLSTYCSPLSQSDQPISSSLRQKDFKSDQCLDPYHYERP